MLVPLMLKTFNNIKDIFIALKNTKLVEAEKLRLLVQQNLQRRYALELLQQEYLVGQKQAGLLKDDTELNNINNKVTATEQEIADSKTVSGAAGTPTGTALAKQRNTALKTQGVLMVIAGAMAAIAFITDAVKRIQNAAAEAAAQTIEKNTKLQATIYENTRIINTIDKLTLSFDDLSNKVVKTAED